MFRQTCSTLGKSKSTSHLYLTSQSHFKHIDIMTQQQKRSLSSLISPKELQSSLSSVKILDGSWHMPNTNRDPLEEYLKKRIVGSQFFGIDTIKDTSSELPHMLPSPDNFASAVGKNRLKFVKVFSF